MRYGAKNSLKWDGDMFLERLNLCVCDTTKKSIYM